MIKNIESISQAELKGKKVLVRVDYNVPLDSELNITDDTRIKASLPTINYLMTSGARIILVSHLGRPKAKVVEELRLDPIAKRLGELLGKEIKKANDSTGAEVQTYAANLQDSQILMLENIRFQPGEEKNDQNLAKELASIADIYVNDAFGTAHRAHASTAGVASYLSPAIAGYLMKKEVEMLGEKLNQPERPFTAIIGGSKISSKISVLKKLVEKVDTLIIGGGMAFTFLKAQGGQIGKSICEDDQIETAREILNIADSNNTAVILPEDTICVADKNIFDEHKTEDEFEIKICDSKNIDANAEGLDIGFKTREHFSKLISQSRTIIWNGPVGVFEYKMLEKGTFEVAKALAELTKNGGTTIVGGGDSVAALEKFNMPKDSMTHVSTGGGASLEFLEGKELPGIACLDKEESQAQTQETNSVKKDFAKELSNAQGS